MNTGRPNVIFLTVDVRNFEDNTDTQCIKETIEGVPVKHQNLAAHNTQIERRNRCPI